MCFHWQEYLGRSEGNIASCSSEGRHFGCRDESQDGSREVHTVRPLCKTTVACAWCEKYNGTLAGGTPSERELKLSTWS